MALSLSGTSQYVLMSGVPVATVPLTLACWFRSANSSVTQALVTVGSQSTAQRFAILARGADAGKPIQASVFSTSGGEANTTSGFAANTWTHAAGVFSANNSRRSYINAGSSGLNTTSVTPSGLDTIMIGTRYNAGYGFFFPGLIAEVGVWSEALAVDEIASLAKGITCDQVRPQSLVFYAPLIGNLSDIARGLSVGGGSYGGFADHTRVYA